MTQTETIKEEANGCSKAFEKWWKANTDKTRNKFGYDKGELEWAWNAAWTTKLEPLSFVDALAEAKRIVAAYPLHRKFIEGTPLENDIAVMMAEFLVKGGNA